MDAFAKSFGLVEESLKAAIHLFGRKQAKNAIRETGRLMSLFGASIEVENAAKAFVALLAQYSDNCIKMPKSGDKSAKKAGAAVQLQKLFNIPA